MDPTDATNKIAATGVVGACLILAIIAIVKMYYDLKAERQSRLDEKDARIEDALKYASLLNASQKEISTISSNLGKVAEAQENEREERERLQRELQFRDRQLERHTPVEEIRPVGLRPGAKR